MAVDPRGADLERYLQEDPGGPVVMLNLLRYAEDSRILYAGDGCTTLVAESGQEWDAVLLVRYPSRAAFSAMVADPDYQQVTQLRTRALTEAVLQATNAW